MVTESQVTELLFFQKTTAYSWKLLSLEITVLWQLEAVLVSTSTVLPPMAPPERYFHSSSFGTNTCRMKMFKERKSPTIFFFFFSKDLVWLSELIHSGWSQNSAGTSEGAELLCVLIYIALNNLHEKYINLGITENWLRMDKWSASLSGKLHKLYTTGWRVDLRLFYCAYRLVLDLGTVAADYYQSNYQLW